MKLAGLGPVALIDEDEDVTLRLEARWQRTSNLFDEALDIILFLAEELVDQRTNEPGRM